MLAGARRWFCNAAGVVSFGAGAGVSAGAGVVALFTPFPGTSPRTGSKVRICWKEPDWAKVGDADKPTSNKPTSDKLMSGKPASGKPMSGKTNDAVNDALIDNVEEAEMPVNARIEPLLNGLLACRIGRLPF